MQPTQSHARTPGHHHHHAAPTHDLQFMAGFTIIGVGALLFIISICTVHLTIWLFVLSFICMLGGTAYVSKVYTGTH